MYELRLPNTGMLFTSFMNFQDLILKGLCFTTQMGLQLTDNPLFMTKKPFVNPDYVCFYKKSAFVDGLTSTEIDDMWLRISDDHNCDTFYFSIVQSMSAFSNMIRGIFRLN